MSVIRLIYKLLGAFVTGMAAARGPSALGKNLVRRQAHKGLARGMRKMGL